MTGRYADALGRLDIGRRVLSAFLIIPILTGVLVVGGPAATYGLVSIASILGLREFYRMTLPGQGVAGKIGRLSLGALLCAAFYWGGLHVVVAVLGVTVVVLFVGQMVSDADRTAIPSRIGIGFLGIVYVPLLLSHVILVHRFPDGLAWVLVLVTGIWVGDTFALLVGSLWGRHKLWPTISPKKTIEGLIGCVAGAIISTLVFKWAFLHVMTVQTAIVIGGGLAVLGQLGDICESVIKRGAHVKDSGTLIPGHGGMLDRLDSLLFTSPFLYYLLTCVLYGPTA